LNNNVSDRKLKYDYNIVTHEGWTDVYGAGYGAVVGSVERVTQF
jgi:hypothetical protein